MSKRKDPRNPAEWREAIDAAAACLAIEACRMYGFIEGGPKIDSVRCDDILERGRARSITPSKSTTRLAVEMIQAYNSGT